MDASEAEVGQDGSYMIEMFNKYIKVYASQSSLLSFWPQYIQKLH